jgi:hypothetical protein
VTAFKKPKRRLRSSWPAYYASTIELERAPQLLKLLCDRIAEREASAPGRKEPSRRETIFGAVMTIYSGRRAQSDLKECVARGYLSRPWNYRTLVRAFEAPATTEILTRLIEESAMPLAEIENLAGQFALGSTVHKWFDQKLHLMIGTATNVVTSARVSSAQDCTLLPELLAATAKRFAVKEVSADPRYLSWNNLEVIDKAGAIPFIPFNRNHISMASRSIHWRKMLGHFLLRNEDFRQRCRRRSSVEATLAAIKALASSGSLRSKLPVARANEVLVMVLLHNLTRICRAIEEFGLDPKLTVASP